MANPPATLLGLGPPEPFEELDDLAGALDAPAETLRPWSTSDDGEDAEEVPFVPLAPLFPRGISPPFVHAGRALGGPPASLSLRVAPQRALWIAVALIGAAALTSMGMLFKSRAPLGPVLVAAGHSPATAPVAGGSRVDPPSPESKPERPPDVPTEEPRTPFKAPRTPSHHRTAPPPSVLGSPEELTESPVLSDPARIRSIADTVRLDDNAARAAEQEAVEPEEAAPAPR